jgi:hypothetical protein
MYGIYSLCQPVEHTVYIACVSQEGVMVHIAWMYVYIVFSVSEMYGLYCLCRQVECTVYSACVDKLDVRCI